MSDYKRKIAIVSDHDVISSPRSRFSVTILLWLATCACTFFMTHCSMTTLTTPAAIVPLPVPRFLTLIRPLAGPSLIVRPSPIGKSRTPSNSRRKRRPRRFGLPLLRTASPSFSAWLRSTMSTCSGAAPLPTMSARITKRSVAPIPPISGLLSRTPSALRKSAACK